MLRYDGSSWTAVQMNGDAEGDIGLQTPVMGQLPLAAGPGK